MTLAQKLNREAGNTVPNSKKQKIFEAKQALLQEIAKMRELKKQLAA